MKIKYFQGFLFGFGYILMGKLDRFLSENRKTIEEKSEKVEPSRIMLTNDLSDEEIMDEIRALEAEIAEQLKKVLG